MVPSGSTRKVAGRAMAPPPGLQRVIQTEPVRETRRLLDGVDRNRDDLGAGGMDFGKT